MDDNRAFLLPREPDLGAEDRLLHVSRRKVVVVVQTDLADADYLGMRGEFAQPGDGPSVCLGRIVRVDADRGPDVLVRVG